MKKEVEMLPVFFVLPLVPGAAGVIDLPCVFLGLFSFCFFADWVFLVCVSWI